MPARDHILHPIRDLVRDWRPGDAAKLTDMLMDGFRAFPGGGGWQFTPDQVERLIRGGDRVTAAVTEDGDRMVAYCDLVAKPGQREHCYVPTLACRPDYHGRKHGKSVLHAVVEWAAEAGFRKVDLNTWAGNMMAVPLYKKTGFMWKPETTVFMENLVPSARRHPLGQAFFRRHDWYATLQRTIELKDDGVARGRVRVYEYLWRAAEDDYLRMVFDRYSWRPIEVETPQLLATCSLPDEKLVAGMPQRVVWRVSNKRPEPVQVFLSARGEPGLGISHRESKALTGTAEFQGAVTIDPEIAEKTQDPSAALLTTEVLVGDTELELTNGIQVRQAVDVVLQAPRGIVRPGEVQRVRLTLRSHLSKKATAHLSLRAVDNVDLQTRAARVALPAHGSAEVVVELRAPRPGAVRFEARALARVGTTRVPTKVFALTALACARDGLAGAVGEDTCMLCGGSLVLFAARRGGHADLHHRMRGERAHRLHLNPPQLGPPFAWEDLFQERGEAWIEAGPGEVSLHLRSASQLHPGIVLHRRIRIGHGPLVQVSDTVTNGGDRAIDLQRRQFVRLRARRALPTRRTVPRPGGLYAEPGAPGWRDLDDWNPPEDEAHWPEGWIAQAGDDGVVSGLIWDRAKVANAGGFLEQSLGRIRPGQTVAAPTFHGLVADGTAQTVRGWWQLLHGPDFEADDALPAPTRAPVELTLDREPVILAGPEVSVRLQLCSVGRHVVEGRIRVDDGEFVRTGFRGQQVTKLTVADPVTAALTLRRRSKRAAGADAVTLRLETAEAEYRSRARVLALESGAAAVEVDEEDGVFAVSNGILALRLAPAFFGAVVSLTCRGQEFLNSSFPDGGQRGWRNPWHGGIHLEYGRLWGSLHRERFRVRIVARRGDQGLVWRGVRVTSRLAQEQARHHTLYAEYLLAPGADVLAVRLGRRDTLGEWLDGSVALDIWTNLAEGPGQGHFHTGDERIIPRAAPHWYPVGAWGWGGLIGDDGRALFIGSGTPDTRTGGWAEGPEGCVLNCEVCREVPAGQGSEAVFFVAPAASVADAQALAPWSAFAALP